MADIQSGALILQQNFNLALLTYFKQKGIEKSVRKLALKKDLAQEHHLFCRKLSETLCAIWYHLHNLRNAQTPMEKIPNRTKHHTYPEVVTGAIL